MIKTYSESEVLEEFSQIVATSLRIDREKVTPDSHITTDLGAESLDLIEITMESEEKFNVWISERTILDIASEVFGEGVLHVDGQLTEEGKRLLLRRIPDADAKMFEGTVSLADLQDYFLRVGSWVNMIYHLLEATPGTCPECGSDDLEPLPGFRLQCQKCSHEIALPSGEELSRQWVTEYYEKEYLPSLKQ